MSPSSVGWRCSAIETARQSGCKLRLQFSILEQPEDGLVRAGRGGASGQPFQGDEVLEATFNGWLENGAFAEVIPSGELHHLDLVLVGQRGIDGVRAYRHLRREFQSR